MAWCCGALFYDLLNVQKIDPTNPQVAFGRELKRSPVDISPQKCGLFLC